jgi:DNA-binding LacI/PurR family transcriptional regulator
MAKRRVSTGPLYLRVKQGLLALVRSGKYAAGQQIPTTAELCRQFAVSSITVRRAVQELTAEGILTGRAGKGLFVRGDAARDSEKLIGLVIPDLTSNPFFGAMIHGIESRLTPAGYRMLIGISGNDPERERDVLQDFAGRFLDGLIVTPIVHRRVPATLELLREAVTARLPVVFLDRRLPNVAADYAGSNNVEGGYQATAHLLARGHRRIGFIYALDANTVRDRLRGYREALADAGVAYVPRLVRGGGGDRLGYDGAGRKHALELLRSTPAPTAILACSDAIALGAYDACRQLGLRVPHDVSVVGYDDLPFGPWCVPPLTTVHQPQLQIGETAAELLLERIANRGACPREVLLRTHLVERGSCAKFEVERKARIA